MSEKKKHRVIIGIELFLLCMIIVTLSINATSANPPSNGVSYNKNNQVTVQNALDDLYNKANYGNATASQILKGRTALVGGKQITGTYVAPTLASQTPGDAKPENLDEGKIAWVNGVKIVGTRTKFAVSLRLGDYISYTPSITSYTVAGEETGYYVAEPKGQVIYPSKLNLWRVIRINADGTVDIIADRRTETVNFYGETGYINYVEVLNKIAHQYETEGITTGSRHAGYADDQLISDALGTTNVGNYYYASGFANGSSSIYMVYYRNNGGIGGVGISTCQLPLVPKAAVNGECYGSIVGNPNPAPRPIVVLRSNLKITGGRGTKELPFEISA